MILHHPQPPYKRNIDRCIIPFLLFVMSLFLPLTSAFGNQEGMQQDKSLRDKALKVFLDVNHRYHSYIKTEIPFVNYVRDRKQAQLYLMITDQPTGSNGREYTINFIGDKEFSSFCDTLTYVSHQTDTEDMVREGIVQTIKLGLVRYIAHTPLSEQLLVRFRTEMEPTSLEDPWNSWVFGVDLSGSFNGEQSSQSSELEAGFTADRVTEEWKTSLFYESTFQWDKYIYSDESDYQSQRERHRFRSSIIKSVTNHFSAGINTGANSDTYSNTKFNYYLAPAIEYNIFPYEVATRKQFRIVYRVSFSDSYYHEETIYGKMQEKLMSQSLSATLDMKEQWGSIRASIGGSHYLHDFSKNHLNLSGNIYLRLLEGLSFRINGRVSMIHDQLSLEMGEATEEEILLHRKEVATNYDYRFGVGLHFSFGSIFNNVVNPRFGF